MKRFFALLISLLALLSAGCGEKEYGILDYQDKNIEAECLVNGKYKIVLKKENGLSTLTVKEPKEISGITFDITSEGIVAKSGETKIQLGKGEIRGIEALCQIFSQNEECLKRADKSGENSVFTFERERCVYVITVGENALPKRVKITSEDESIYLGYSNA